MTSRTMGIPLPELFHTRLWCLCAPDFSSKDPVYTKSNCNQGACTRQKQLNNNYKRKYIYKKLNLVRLIPGLAAFYAIRPGNGSGLFYSSQLPGLVLGMCAEYVSW